MKTLSITTSVIFPLAEPSPSFLSSTVESPDSNHQIPIRATCDETVSFGLVQGESGGHRTQSGRIAVPGL